MVVISPNQIKNLRGRYAPAGSKDDRFDAYVLPGTLRTDRARLAPLTPDSPATVTLRRACRARKDLVSHRVALASQLRAHLLNAFPARPGCTPASTPRSACASWPAPAPRTAPTGSRPGGWQPGWPASATAAAPAPPSCTPAWPPRPAAPPPTPTTPAPGPPGSTTKPASSPAPGSSSSGTAGKTRPPTTPATHRALQRLLQQDQQTAAYTGLLMGARPAWSRGGPEIVVLRGGRRPGQLRLVRGCARRRSARRGFARPVRLWRPSR